MPALTRFYSLDCDKNVTLAITFSTTEIDFFKIISIHKPELR